MPESSRRKSITPLYPLLMSSCYYKGVTSKSFAMKPFLNNEFSCGILAWKIVHAISLCFQEMTIAFLVPSRCQLSPSQWAPKAPCHNWRISPEHRSKITSKNHLFRLGRFMCYFFYSLRILKFTSTVMWNKMKKSPYHSWFHNIHWSIYINSS